jgi:hypothetical protein
LAALAGFAVLSLPAAAQNSVPSYASSAGETIHGTIASVNGGELSLRDDRGFVDRVAIHTHVVMHPADLQLAADQSVTIVGHADGRVFIADEIDLTQSGPAAYGDAGNYGTAYGPDYVPAPVAYPYPYYPYYPYYGGPFFGASIGFYFGGGYGHYYPYRGGYHGGYPHGGYAGGTYSHGGYSGGYTRGGLAGHASTAGGASAGGHGGGGRR